MHWKKLISLLIVLLAVILYRYLREQNSGRQEQSNAEKITHTTTEEADLKNTRTDKDYLQSLRENDLEYTKHGMCRIDCRKIDKTEVLEILENGHINWKKSDLNDKPCPSFAVEGTTRDGQLARVVFAGCDNETRVITAIDLETDWPCDCY